MATAAVAKVRPPSWYGLGQEVWLTLSTSALLVKRGRAVVGETVLATVVLTAEQIADGGLVFAG